MIKLNEIRINESGQVQVIMRQFLSGISTDKPRSNETVIDKMRIKSKYEKR